MSITTLTAFEQRFNALNLDERHYENRNDICTPMECVQEMAEAIPKAFWRRASLRVLDPCAGNGNFHAYLRRYTKLENLVFNKNNEKRIANIRNLFGNRAVITKQDFLAYDERARFALIVANPPYA